MSEDDKEKSNKIILSYTKTQIVAEIATACIMLAMILYPIMIWDSIPASIPMHYNAVGEIDSWASKGTLMILPIISLIIYLLLTVVTGVPAIWNMPVIVNKKNQEKVYGSGRTLLILLKAEMAGTFFYIEYHDAKAEMMPALFLVVDLIIIFGTLIYFIAKMYRDSK